MTRALLLACLLLVAPPLHAQSWQDEPDADEAAWLEQQAGAADAYHARIATALAASGNVRDQVFAEILRPAAGVETRSPAGDAPSRAVPRDPESDARLRAIASRAGDDRLALQLLVVAISDPASPLRARIARRWQAADPGNLVPLLHAGLGIDALLAEARRTTHASTRMYDAVRWMMAAYLRHPLTATELAAISGGGVYHAEEAAAVSTIGMWAAIAVPSLRTLVEACRPDALRATPTRAADCRHVADVFADHSDGTLDRMVGLSMLRALAVSNAERAAIDARQRTTDWQMMHWGRIAQQQERDGAAQFVRLLRDASIQNELQLAERVLAEAGVPLQPPAGWTPPRR